MPFRCPWCQSERTRRSKTRGFFEAFLAKLSVKPFRCHDCDCRFFRTRLNHRSKPSPLARPSSFASLHAPPVKPAAALPK
jgi:predicted Zn-ribbon and HTH transcriptional regulator